MFPSSCMPFPRRVCIQSIQFELLYFNIKSDYMKRKTVTSEEVTFKQYKPFVSFPIEQSKIYIEIYTFSYSRILGKLSRIYQFASFTQIRMWIAKVSIPRAPHGKHLFSPKSGFAAVFYWHWWWIFSLVFIHCICTNSIPSRYEQQGGNTSQPCRRQPSLESPAWNTEKWIMVSGVWRVLNL